VTVRIIEGTSTARAHLSRLRRRDGEPLPESVAARLKEIFGCEISADNAVSRVIKDVRLHGDAALRDYTQRIDGIVLNDLSLDGTALLDAYRAAPAGLRDALQLAADRIRAFHDQEPRNSWLAWDDDGGALGQMVHPIQRVGVYVPGGTAAYPSSLLMAVIPAQVAGVEELVATTPPGPNGRGSPAVLAAAHVAGLDRLYLLGGAQAVAALAYGTGKVPAVDKIVGAGGLFVTLAKKQVYGDVGIDGLYGPTETLLIADDTASPVLVAADLLAQAEHDPLATALLITPSARLGRQVQAEADRQLLSLERRDVIEESFRGQGAILVVNDLGEAVELANLYAPEHLCLLVADPWALVGRVQNAGGIFVGEGSSEALGDYVVGPSHIMPTRGTARFASPLHVRDFLKVTSVLAVGHDRAQRLAPPAQTIAQAEGLSAHAAAVAARGTVFSGSAKEPDGGGGQA
jgi:histidinol dehydrogenase